MAWRSSVRNYNQLMLEKDYNFNSPLEVTEVFRTEEGEEFSAKALLLWENVELVEEYPYEDNWRNYPGDKYQITLRGGMQKLILGSFDSMKEYWTMFRNANPMFGEE